MSLQAWHRKTFAVHLLSDPTQDQGERAELVSGLVSGPFGIYSGSSYRVEPGRYTLVHLPSQVAKLTLPRQSFCRAAAQELPLWISPGNQHGHPG